MKEEYDRKSRFRQTLIDFYTKYGLDKKSSDVEMLVSDIKWKGKEDELFDALFRKYEKSIVAILEEERHQHDKNAYDEEDDAPKDEPGAQPSHEETLNRFVEQSARESDEILRKFGII